MRKKKLRKYEPAWNILKSEGVICLQLQPVEMTTQQAINDLKVIRKAMTKEKYQDLHYKAKYPNSRLSYSLDPGTNIVTITLDNGEFDL